MGIGGKPALFNLSQTAVAALEAGEGEGSGGEGPGADAFPDPAHGFSLPAGLRLTRMTCLADEKVRACVCACVCVCVRVCVSVCVYQLLTHAHTPCGHSLLLSVL